MAYSALSVPASYLKTLFAEVLNATYEDVETENSSESWVRQGMSDKRVSTETVKGIVEKRYGDKVTIANPFDPISIDDAISNGYNVVHGAELSKEEWGNIRKAEAIKSSTELFGRGFAPSSSYEPDDEMLKVATFAKRIAERLLGLVINVQFIKSPQAGVNATFDNSTLTFNVSHLKGFFNPTVSERTINLIVHELGHSAGHHTEVSYHKCITKMTDELVMIALTEPTFFNIE